MKVVLKPEYLQEYNERQIVAAVYNLFDDYNYKKLILKGYFDDTSNHDLNYKPEDLRYRKNSDYVSSKSEEKEKVQAYIDKFEKKLNIVLEKLTDEEKIIYKYSIRQRLRDKEIFDKVCKQDKKYYQIKKSCFVKFALSFDLVDGFTKNVFATISLIN